MFRAQVLPFLSGRGHFLFGTTQQGSSVAGVTGRRECLEGFGCVVSNSFEYFTLLIAHGLKKSSHSVLSKELNTILKTQFPEHALVLLKAAKRLRSQGVSDDHTLAALRAKKEQLMAETYRILTTMLGAPLNSDQTFIP
ncbi:hypothetical protein B0H13DRAFT_1923665 [Mycena leptocephala]|nr:hypothetical protein B0H13DRAFT_1923665 [Mycena leptocephala]